MKKTKIVCTIGPKTESKEMLTKMLDAGMNVMRLNFSHGDYQEHGNRIKNVREVCAETGKQCAKPRKKTQTKQNNERDSGQRSPHAGAPQKQNPTIAKPDKGTVCGNDATIALESRRRNRERGHQTAEVRSGQSPTLAH